MTPYCRQFIPDDETKLFAEIKKTIEALPDVDLGIDENGEPIILSCHMLTRAVAKVFSLTYEDGLFLPYFPHSWIIFPSNAVLDLYPVAILGGPFMMAGGAHSIIRNYYKKMSAKYIARGRFSKPSFRRSVRKIIKALEQTRDAEVSPMLL